MQSIRYSCQILMKGEFPRQIFDILPVGAELFHADRQTDGWTDRQGHMTKLIVVFRNFAKVP